VIDRQFPSVIINPGCRARLNASLLLLRRLRPEPKERPPVENVLHSRVVGVHLGKAPLVVSAGGALALQFA